MKYEVITLDKDFNVTLSCYRHEKSAEMPNVNLRPAVLVFPGGAYRVCSDREAEPVALAYLAEGYHAFVLRYTVGEAVEHPKPLRDAEAAIKTLTDNADSWGIDASRIAVVGFSAGGHLAVSLGTLGAIRPAALILGYPGILSNKARSIFGDMPELDTVVDGKTPPSFIFTTSEDEIVPVEHSLRYAAALDRAGVPFEMHIYQKGVHGLSLAKPLTSSGLRRMVEPRVSAWFAESAAWLKELWGDFEHNAVSNTPGVLNEFEAYGVDVALEYLWANPKCREIIIKHIPEFSDEKAARSAMSVSLRFIAGYKPGFISGAVLETLDTELRSIPVK
ncbi:MAG: alpha/beta hydrolase [Clostridiales bacterium]|jgi:acetyl esterase/lipase|nr:alpha/beta hydrolase [Clostridiales bacterium]